MIRSARLGFALVVLAVAGPSACGSSGDGASGNAACIAGATQRCVGSAACSGGQVCTGSGTWGPCDCGSAGTGGEANTGGRSGTGGTNTANGGSGQGGSGSSTGGVGLSTGGLWLSTGGSSAGGSTSTGGSGVLLDGGCEGGATRRADVVFVIDNSGSMSEEIAAVQSGMNAFAQQIVGAGIDLHVVLVSAPVCGNDFTCLASVGFNFNGICIPAPLGNVAAGASCPNAEDTKLPNYLHVKSGVDSHNALAQLESTFPTWQPMLRPDAAKTFVVITDDEAAMTASDFQSWVDAQTEFQGATWRFSGVFCQTSSSNCAGMGVTYSQLVSATGGKAANLGSASSGSIDPFIQNAFASFAAAIEQDASAGVCP